MASPLLIFLALLALIHSKGAFATMFTFKNNCAYTIWPGTVGFSVMGQLETTGFELKPGASTPLDSLSPWKGRIWARLSCTTDRAGKFSCLTGDCGTGKITCDGRTGAPPATLLEFTIFNSLDMDVYKVSLVEGFNVPASITPTGIVGGCNVSSCARDVNRACPRELQFHAPDGKLAGCNSACTAFKTDRYCCKGAYGDRNKCGPTNYSKFFKDQCPQANSYPFDDESSSFECLTGGANYLITFCP